MSIEPLKNLARAHAQKEEWGKAVDLYKKAIAKLEQEEQPDIGLYNRVADLQVRQGQLEDAAALYEKAINLYVEAGLPNNAIAVCKKVVRNMPKRHTVYLTMGQIRGRQGFRSEARQNFLTYAERMQSAGKIDEGLRALGELADLVPEDVEVRLAIAAQMQVHGRTDDAIAQLQHGYHAAGQRGLPTGPFETMLEQLGATPGAPPVGHDELGGFGEIQLAGDEGQEAAAAPEEELPGFGEIVVGAGEEGHQEEEEATPLPMFDFSADQDEREGAAVLPPLPLLGDGFASTRDDSAAPVFAEEEGGELNVFAFDERQERPGEFADKAVDLPENELGGFELESPDGAAPAEVAGPGAEAGEALESAMEEARAEQRAAQEGPPPPSASPEGPHPSRPTLVPDGMAPRPERPSSVSEKDPMGHAALASRGDLPGAMTALRKLVKGSPSDLGLRQKMVEYAQRLNDPPTTISALLELAEVFERQHLDERARSVYQQVLSLDQKNARALQGLGQQPKTAAPGGDFIDLGSMLLDDAEEKTTRFVVAYEEPSGDEQADFAKMLSQFRAKVSENLDADDVRAHQDLGTAYKEMGLIDEAISEFQQALRASVNYLPSYELLGQCFIEKGEPEAAVKTLRRALDVPREVEDELLGVYYWLGRAHQQLGNKVDAVEFYDRVFSLDINFADVTERLRALR